jgi:hypothetical protein
MLRSVKWLIPYRRFGSTYRSHLQGSRSPRGIYIAACLESRTRHNCSSAQYTFNCNTSCSVPSTSDGVTSSCPETPSGPPTSDGVTSPCPETPNDNALFRFDVGALTLNTASTTLHWCVQVKSYKSTRIISFNRALLLKEAACFLWGRRYVIKY